MLKLNRRAGRILDSRLCQISDSPPVTTPGDAGVAVLPLEQVISGESPVLETIYSMIERGSIVLGTAGPLLVCCRQDELTGYQRTLRFDTIGPQGFACAFAVSFTSHGLAWQKLSRAPRSGGGAEDSPDARLFEECCLARPSAERIEKLLHLGANPNVSRELTWLNGENASCLTALVCRPDGADCADATARLLAAGADPNATTSLTHRTPVHFAVAHDKLDSLRLLLVAGADANALAWDPKFASPLRLAILGGAHLKYKYLEILFSAGARFDLNDCSGMTPIHFAIERRDLASLRSLLLLGNQQSLNVVADGSGMTPLQWAIAKWGGLDAVRLLLAHGARPGATGRGGLTALHTAAACGQTEAATLLVNAGCPVDARSSEGETAAELLVRMHGALPRGWAEILGRAEGA